MKRLITIIITLICLIGVTSCDEDRWYDTTKCHFCGHWYDACSYYCPYCNGPQYHNCSYHVYYNYYYKH